MPNRGRTSVQRLFKRLEKRANEKHMKLNKVKVKSCSWDGLTSCNSTNRVATQHCVPFGDCHYKKDRDILEQVIWRTTKIVRGLEHVVYMERLK